jgi:hypothetical protein
MHWAAGASEAKRPKLDADRPIIRPSLLSDESRAELKAGYAKASPYPHVVFKDVCDPELLRAVREEIINNIEATYKETDLYKMFQTGAGSAAGGQPESGSGQLQAGYRAAACVAAAAPVTAPQQQGT